MAKTFDELFSFWDSSREMAGDVGVTHWTVEKWKQRRRIDQDNWPEVISAAARKGKKLSADDLLSMHRPKSRASLSRAAG